MFITLSALHASNVDTGDGDGDGEEILPFEAYLYNFLDVFNLSMTL